MQILHEVSDPILGGKIEKYQFVVFSDLAQRVIKANEYSHHMFF